MAKSSLPGSLNSRICVSCCETGHSMQKSGKQHCAIKARMRRTVIVTRLSACCPAKYSCTTTRMGALGGSLDLGSSKSCGFGAWWQLKVPRSGLPGLRKVLAAQTAVRSTAYILRNPASGTERANSGSRMTSCMHLYAGGLSLMHQTKGVQTWI